MKRKSTIIGYELADQVAERLADKAMPISPISAWDPWASPSIT